MSRSQKEWTEDLYRERMSVGCCRHCGGAVPCWSYYGDQKVGKKHTHRSHAAMQDARAKR